MRQVLQILAAAAIGALLAGADVAAANSVEELRPINLRVFDGADTWHTDSSFQLRWDRPPAASPTFPITGIGYRVRDPLGAIVLPDVRLPGDTDVITGVYVPRLPGAYTADVWLEGPNGAPGPTVSTTLRFDDSRPAGVHPLTPPGWVAGNQAAIVRITHPAAPLPVSGIRGYAVSVDSGAGGAPCSNPDRCDIEETNLRAGINDDQLSLGILPEGTHVVHAIAVSGAGVSSAQVGSGLLRVDATRPEVHLAGASRGWANGPVRLTATAVDALSGMAAVGPSGAQTAIAVDGGVPRAEPGGSATIMVAEEGTHRVAAFARDAAGNTSEDFPVTGTVSIDEAPPKVAFARTQDPSEPERIEATVTDVLSGVDPARGSIAVRVAGSRRPWLPLPTDANGGRLLARWNSDSFPVGSYEFRATGYDRAGNEAVSERRANNARMILANPVKAATRLEAGFGGRLLIWHRCRREDEQRRCRQEAIRSFAARPKVRTVPYGRALSYTGRLASSSGSPLAGLPVQVVESLDAGADLAPRSTTVLTGPDGGFSVRLAPGPSRRVEARFGGSRVLTRAAGGEVWLGVRADLRLQVSSGTARIGGGPVVFSGHVGDLDASIPRTGLEIDLQFKAPSGEWEEFRSVRTDPRGRFRYPYAFSDDDSRGVRFQFRAKVESPGDWPYEEAFSRPVEVVGR